MRIVEASVICRKQREASSEVGITALAVATATGSRIDSVNGV
jgi:hypothetical protein